jgi:predicted RNA-binding protein YlqC (UPF0109 family)
MPQDQQFLEFVIKGLVDKPEDVKVTRIVDQMGVLLTLTVHKDDMGKIIGKDGATAKAIRTLLRVAGMKSEARVNLKINEPDGSPYVPAARADKEENGYTRAPHQNAPAHEAGEHVDAADVPKNYQSEPKESPRMKSVDEILESL